MINLPPYPNDTTPDWPGLTLQEIRMRRTLVQARMERQKFKMAAQIDGYRQKVPFFGGSQSMFSRLAGAFTMAEYGYFAIKAFRLVAPLFRRKR